MTCRYLRRLVVACAIGWTLTADAQAQECFRGTWIGELSGGGGAIGNARKLVVRPAQGGGDDVRWGQGSNPNPPATTNIEFSGTTLRFTTSEGSKIEASCQGATVTGTFYPLRGGRTSNFTLAKQ
jgi:hypothetical protein